MKLLFVRTNKPFVEDRMKEHYGESKCFILSNSDINVASDLSNFYFQGVIELFDGKEASNFKCVSLTELEEIVKKKYFVVEDL